MKVLFLRFWPVLVPLIIGLVLVWLVKRKKEPEAAKAASARIWFWSLTGAIIVLLATLLWQMFATQETVHTHYEPAQYIDGKLVPGREVPESKEREVPEESTK